MSSGKFSEFLQQQKTHLGVQSALKNSFEKKGFMLRGWCILVTKGMSMLLSRL